ncbi:MAG TPA: hypothetical protein VGF28_19945 [Thermoanaerobaculia bacterium]
MMTRRLLLLLTLSIAGDRPCAQESLPTVPAPLADSEFTFSLCNHCGSEPPSILGALLYGIVLLPFVLGFKRLLLGRDELVLLRVSEPGSSEFLGVPRSSSGSWSCGATPPRNSEEPRGTRIP